MTLDRESIEKKDFPVARRGYEPSAVDAHLTLLADEVEQLRRRSHSPTEPLATAVSERVRGIVEAAEASAAEILATAELEARELRMQATEAAQTRLEATGKAQREREEAAAQAQDYVSRLSSSISEMLERLDGMESELSALTASLRTGTERLRGELAALEDELEGVIAATASEVAGEEEPSAARRAVAPPARIREEAARGAPAAADFLQEEPAAGTSSGQPAVGLSDDAEGAQLIALNMALNGTARDETDRYLAENFDLRDRQRLLDDVYASVGRA